MLCAALTGLAKQGKGAESATCSSRSASEGGSGEGTRGRGGQCLLVALILIGTIKVKRFCFWLIIIVVVEDAVIF